MLLIAATTELYN